MRSWLALLMLICLSAMMAPDRLSARDDVAYKVAAGDTLFDLAERHFVNRGDWRSVARINRIRNPRHLQPGRILVIPKRLLKFRQLRAELVSYRGQLSIRDGDGSARQIRVGVSVGEGATIATAENSFASFRLTGAGTVSLPSVTTVRVERLRQYSLGEHVERRLVLVKGRADVSASGARKDTDEDILEIRTRRATAAIRGTEFSISTSPTGEALSVHEGTVEFSLPDSGESSDASAESIDVAAGFGSVATDQGLRQAVELLPKADLLEPGRIRTESASHFAVTPVPGAASYRFTVGLDANLIETIAESETVASETTIADLPDGTLYLRVSAISAEGLEGERRIYAIRRRFAEVTGSAETGEDDTTRFRWQADGMEGPIRFILSRAEDLSTPLADVPNIVTGELPVEGLPPGTYFWATEQRLIDQGAVERVRGPVRELIIPSPE